MPDVRARHVAGLLLASGRGTRFDPAGRLNKLCQLLPDGRSVIAASASNLLAAGLEVTVIAPNDARIFAALAHLPVHFCDNPTPELGMGASIALGVKATPEASAWLVALGDMPFIEVATVTAVISALFAQEAQIAAPFIAKERGHPVIFARALGAALQRLDGDSGARGMLATASIMRVESLDYGILRDIDRPHDLLE